MNGVLRKDVSRCMHVLNCWPIMNMTCHFMEEIGNELFKET